MTKRSSSARTRGATRAPRSAGTDVEALVEASRRLNEAAGIVIQETGAASPGASGNKRKKKVSTRDGKIGLVLYLEPETAHALRRLARTHDASMHQLGLCAIQMLFEAYGIRQPSSPAPRATRS